MNPARFSQMTGAITGFELRITAWRSTLKLSQDKAPGERERVAAGIEASGHGALAHLMRQLGEEGKSA
jgi:transcriptional regulator